MRITWPILSLLFCFLIEVNSEPQAETKHLAKKPTEADYSVYDFLGNTKPKVKSILNFKKWVEDDIKYHRKLIVLVYYSKNKCLQCAFRERVLQEVVERFHPQVDFYRYNCDEEFEKPNAREDQAATGRYKVDSCHKNYPDRLPTVSFLVPQISVFFPYDPISFQKPQYEPDFSDPNSLADMVSSYMPVYAKKIKNIEDANNFVEKFGYLPKALYFLNSEETPIYFKGLTAVFKDKLEFGLVSHDAYEVVEFFNITSRPRWIVVKIKNLVFMEKRQYRGRLTFSDVSNYLSLFASKNATDRTQTTEIGSKRVRDSILKNGSKIFVEEIDYDNFKSNLNYPEDVIILHVTDTFSMNYPNLHTFQTFYGNLTKYEEAIGNTLNKKRMIRRVLPKEHVPYIIVYPRGNLTHKLRNKKVLGANHTIEHLLQTVSRMLPDTIEFVENEMLENKIVKSVFDRKLTLVVFHKEEEVSMGLRRLALSPYYRKYFDFYQMKNPPKDRLRQLSIGKLSKLVMFMADPVLLAEPDSMPPIDKVSFEMAFIFDNLKMFLDDMITEHGKYLQDVSQVFDEAQLKSILTDSGKIYHLLFIVDKAKEIRNDQLVDRMNDMLILKKFGGKDVASAYFDYGCYPYLGELFRFREKEVPLMVIFDGKESSYLRSDFKLNIYDGRDFIEKAVLSDQYRGRYRKVNFQLGPNKCLQSEDKVDL